ncbi:motility associated factor glycosyltransferase family protein [Tepidibacter aestuarii]|uniref:motility associated factor glycosyltransferase family protein n=1 Tax=Tepidibacter aestuarii TaxID=2925782 RepID=UPI0020BFEF53|nr:6-hydroxymethylpterin diphosphokinase MptE-like protein [Tepidibacter aestuarii]CAH2211885.1 conserved protein of unknown function [Tepidibacter aestuarii]
MKNINKNIYIKNIELLKQYYPEYIKVLEDNKYNDEKVKVIETRDGNISLIVEKGKKITIHSKYKPIEEAKRWTKNIQIEENDCIFVFGMGLLYHVDFLLEKIRQNNKLIIIEPSIEVLKKTISVVDLENIILNNNISIVLYNDEHFKDRVSKILMETGLQRINYKYLKLQTYVNAFVEEYRDYLNVLNNAKIDILTQKNTIINSSEEWTKNDYKNLKHLKNSINISCFFNKFKNIPAILVSAGPSLDKNIEYIRNFKDKCLIIAVDTSLKALITKDINPHMVISVDGTYKNYDKIKGLDFSNIPLVYTNRVYYKILEEHKGKKIIYDFDSNIVSNLFSRIGEDIGILEEQGSVSTCALDFLIKIGANPIVFVGQDLAYTDDKKYAQNTMYDYVDYERYGDFGFESFVDGYYGGKVKTDYALRRFLEYFETRIYKEKEKIEFINATEGGANIKGCKNITLKNLKNEFENKINIGMTINNIFKIKSIINNENKDRFVKELEKMYLSIKNIENKLNQVLKQIEQLHLIYDKNDYYYKIKEIKEIIAIVDQFEEFLQNKKDEIILMNYELFKWEQEVIAITKNSNILNIDERQKGLIIAKNNKIIYEKLKDIVIDHKKKLETCLSEI